MHRTDKHSQHSSIIWPLWLNGSGLQLSHRESRITISFQKLAVKFVTLLEKFTASIFPSMNTLSFNFFNDHKLVLHLSIASNNL